MTSSYIHDCEGFIVDTSTSYSTFTLDGYVYISQYF
nr:MAG TPA: hypothetical protein [Caudoviricetes sp.]DAS25548.1 MAG TPA: hypothetical protein [Bacteriophage sp.]